MEDKIYKCDSCGANLKKENKYCDYCGGVNKHYVEPKRKELELPEIKINDIFEDMLNDFPFNSLFNTRPKKK